jgi:hypothetical protein
MLSLFIAVSADAEKVSGGYFILLYNKSDVLADVRINGIPVITMENKDSASGQMDVNYWICPGKNNFSINIKELKRKNENSYYNPKLKAALYIIQKGQFPDEGTLVVKYEWPEAFLGDENKSETEKKLNFPVSKIIEFEPEFVPPSELWSKAEAVNLTENDKKEIISLLKDFESSFNSRNYDKIYQISEFRGFDTSRSRYYAITKEQMMKDLKSLTPDKSMKIKNVSDGKYKFNKLFNGQIYKIASSTDKSPLVYVSKDGTGDIDIYVSKISGKWVLSR